MKKISLIICCSISSVLCFSQQHLYFNFFAGLASYQGDLGSPSFYLSNANGVGGMGAIVELNHRMNINGGLNFGKVSGFDKNNINTQARNLSFYSNITEFYLLFEYVLFDLYEHSVSPYFYAGLATFKFSPYTKTANGDVVVLAELSTEGQGFYKDREKYKLNEFAFPFGGGLQWALSPNKRLALEVGLRKTTTDYLDDVSTTYIDQVLLAQEKGFSAVNLAYRGDELPNGAPYPNDGSIRGNPDNKDWYIFTGISFRISIQPRLKTQTYQYKPIKAKTSCPTVF